jgi:predicted nucleic acid-binding protein
MTRRIYVDSGVLLAAARGTDSAAREAFAVLDDLDAEFASSIFVRLELLPKAIYNRRPAETQFYEAFFMAASVWADITPRLAQTAFDVATMYGLSAMDALHVAAALAINADEFVTSERASSPLLRVRILSIRTIHPTDAEH